MAMIQLNRKFANKSHEAEQKFDQRKSRVSQKHRSGFQIQLSFGCENKKGEEVPDAAKHISHALYVNKGAA
jgi:hypothetical protein